MMQFHLKTLVMKCDTIPPRYHMIVKGEKHPLLLMASVELLALSISGTNYSHGSFLKESGF